MSFVKLAKKANVPIRRSSRSNGNVWRKWATQSQLNDATKDLATKAELQQGLDGKAATQHGHGIDDVSGLAQKLASQDGAIAGQSDAITQLDGKVNTLQAQVDGLGSGAQSGGEPVNLDNYYQKSETYSQEEVNTALGLKVDAVEYTAAMQGVANALANKLEASALTAALDPLNLAIVEKVGQTAFTERNTAVDNRFDQAEYKLTELETAMQNADSGKRLLIADANLADFDEVQLNSKDGGFTLTVPDEGAYIHLKDIGRCLDTNSVFLAFPDGDTLELNSNGVEAELFKKTDSWEFTLK